MLVEDRQQRAEADDRRLQRPTGLRHLPGLHDQSTHGRRGPGGVVHSLGEALKRLVPDDQPDEALTFDDGRYFDWGTTDADVHSLEFGDAEGAVQVGLVKQEMRQLVSAMSLTLLRNQAAPPDPDDRQSVLLASLMLAGEHGGVTFGDIDEVPDAGRYFDWSSRGDGGSYLFEGGTAGDSIQVELTPEEFAQLHAQLVRSLLERAAADDRQQRDRPVRTTRRPDPSD